MRMLGVPGRPLALALCGALILATAEGCAFGPRVLEQTHGRYQESLRLVNEEQLIRNLVHERYDEGPMSLNVSSIAAQYELSGGADVQPFFTTPNPASTGIFRTFTRFYPSANVSGSNRPTITLVPANDGDAVRRFLTPISNETLTFLTETSWPVSVVFRLWVERLNGVPNAVTASGPSRGVISDYGRFLRISELMQLAQDREMGSMRVESRDVEVGGPVPAGAVTPAVVLDAAKNGLEYRPCGDGRTWAVLRKENRLVMRVNPVASGSPELLELERLLNLMPGLPEYDVVVAPGVVLDPLTYPRPPGKEVRIMTRSNSQVMFYLANGVEVPPEHLACGLARPLHDAAGRCIDGRELTRGLFEIHACKGHKPPAAAHVAVKYRNCWYYIDDRDHASKATLMLMLQLSRLDFGNDKPAAPFLTLPLGR
jgi:hypothetical protein